MRFIVGHWNLFAIICWFTLPLGQAQSIDSVWFPSTNFTYCNNTPNEFHVYSVNRYFDVNKSVYYLNFTSSSNSAVTNLNQQGTSKNLNYNIKCYCYSLSFHLCSLFFFKNGIKVRL